MLKLLIGFGIVMGLRLAIKPLLPPGPVFDFFRYSVMGLWMGVGAPLVFVLARLSKGRKGTEPTVQPQQAS